MLKIHLRTLFLVSCLFLAEVNASELVGPTILLPSQPGGVDSATCPEEDPELNYRPVIGILSHPGDGTGGRLRNTTDVSYIAASYVKFVEAGGARVIPINFEEPEETIFKKLELVNGVLFTGGSAKKYGYYEAVKKVFKKALQRNDAGEHFPVYAICLGYELLSIIISEDRSILQKINATYAPTTLQFVKNANIKGTVFERFPRDLLKKLKKDCLAMQVHHWGISPERFLNNSALSGFFKIITTCLDDDNKPYVSTVQSRKYPVTGLQWHPEKNAFEWGMRYVPHTEDAIRVTQQAANHFISEARKSSNRPDAQQVLDNLIYNYSPTFSGYGGKGFDEVYLFIRPNSSNVNLQELRVENAAGAVLYSKRA